MELVETEVEHKSLSGKTAWENLTEWDTGVMGCWLLCVEGILCCDLGGKPN